MESETKKIYEEMMEELAFWGFCGYEIEEDVFQSMMVLCKVVPRIYIKRWINKLKRKRGVIDNSKQKKDWIN